MSFLTNLMKTVSGGENEYRSEQLLFDKVIGVRGIVDGVGASTVVYNLAAALADTTRYHICVLDTHVLFPTLRGLLCTQAAPTKDWFDFTADLSEIVCATKFKNVKYIGFYYRTLVDMLSTKDSRAVLDNLMTVLKEVFDIILVDLSMEHTVVGTNAAVQCNKIYTVVSPEPASMFAFKTSVNTAVTTAVPAYKLRNVIFNKSLGRFDNTMLEILKENTFNVLCKIPYSDELLQYNWSGNSFWGAVNRSKDITNANNAIAVIVKDIVEPTTLNSKYIAEGQHNEDMSAVQTDIEDLQKTVQLQTNKQIRTETKHVQMEQKKPTLRKDVDSVKRATQNNTNASVVNRNVQKANTTPVQKQNTVMQTTNGQTSDTRKTQNVATMRKPTVMRKSVSNEGVNDNVDV